MTQIAGSSMIFILTIYRLHIMNRLDIRLVLVWSPLRYLTC